MRLMSILVTGFAAALCSCSNGESSHSNSTPMTTQIAVGNEGPGGGNFEAQEAARLSGELLLLVKQNQPTYPEVDWTQLETAVLKTKIFMMPTVIVRGHETDASNNGLDEIQISTSRWQLKSDRLAKIALLFHEYLGILGLESNSYGISNRIMNPAYTLASGVRYACVVDSSTKTEMTARYNVISDTYFFAFQSVGYENCGNLELVGRKSGGKFQRIGACRYGFRNWDQLEFLDGQGLFFSQSINPNTMTCYPIRETASSHSF